MDGSIITITRVCIDPHQTGFVGKKGIVTNSSLLLILAVLRPRGGRLRGQNFLAPPYYSQRAVFASLWALFHFYISLLVNLQIQWLVTLWSRGASGGGESHPTRECLELHGILESHPLQSEICRGIWQPWASQTTSSRSILQLYYFRFSVNWSIFQRPL